MADGAGYNLSRCRRESKWVPAQRCLRGAVPRHVWAWLVDASSLTRRLRRICGAGFHVRVLYQGWGRPQASERHALYINSAERVVIREVRLMCGEQPWVFARTVIPVRSLRGTHRRLAYLGSKSLGAALFADPQLRRGEVEVTQVGPGEQLFAHALGSLSPVGSIWGRRSVFWSRSRSLLVSEFFLPEMFRQLARDRYGPPVKPEDDEKVPLVGCGAM